MIGADASVHLAEETENAARNIPRAIIASMCINGLVGFVMMVTILFCVGDVQSVLETATGYPFIAIFYNSTNSVVGATVMGALVLILTWLCATGIITTSSRMVWSFARDRGTPFSAFLTKVSRTRRIPVAALCVACFFACLLTLIYVGSSTAFNDVVSLTITGFYSSYFLPAAFLLWHRIKGRVAPHSSRAIDKDYDHTDVIDEQGLPGYSADQNSFPEDRKVPETFEPIAERRSRKMSMAEAPLVFGPFSLPSWIGIINNAYACAYMIFVIFWSVWPPDTPVDAENMNYSVVVTGGVIIFSIAWYYIRGRKEYDGPTVDEEVEQAVRKNSVVR